MRLLIGCPTTRGVHPAVVQNLISFDLDNQNKKNDLRVYFPQSSLLTFSRNNIMREALKFDADWCLMWDDDTEIKDTNFFNLMIETAFKMSASVVGLPVRLKTNDEIIFNFADKQDGKYVNYKYGDLPKEPKEVGVIGTAVMLINMAWIRKNWPKAPWFSVIDTETGAWPEDWFFTEKVWEKGGKVVVEPRIATVHHGQIGYT